MKKQQFPIKSSSHQSALCGFSSTLANELQRYSITINIISPWYTQTQMTHNVPSHLIANSPAGRLLDPMEVAPVVLRVCCGEYSGKDFVVDGVNDPFADV
jgi:NAD(P)-dependent dehydrogenase (short-subunit alcohol dehydrogenase family)